MSHYKIFTVVVLEDQFMSIIVSMYIEVSYKDKVIQNIAEEMGATHVHTLTPTD